MVHQNTECEELWCRVKQDVCITKGEKVADGTLCGDRENYVKFYLKKNFDITD